MSQSFWNSKRLFITEIVRSYIIFVYIRAISPLLHPPGKKFFTVGIFRKNISKYVKLMIESYICDNLNQIYRLFAFLAGKFWNSFCLFFLHFLFLYSFTSFMPPISDACGSFSFQLFLFASLSLSFNYFLLPI